MSIAAVQYVYGPVPSRRLGRSLGVDLVPFKTCTYDCVYCQLGRTTRKVLERMEYVPIPDVIRDLEARLAEDTAPDYISLAGSGEPTLNSGIGEVIRRIKTLTDIPLAVLTNGSLLWMEEVQDALMAADLVLPSLDAGCERLFRRVNRPHREIRLDRVVDGLVEFTRRFPREVWLEIFLLADVTASPIEAGKIADLVKRIGPVRVQLNTVARPPAEPFALPVPRDQLLTLQKLFPGVVDIISETDPKVAEQSGHSLLREEDLMALLRRRPCTAKDLAGGLGIHVTEALKHLSALLASGKVNRSVADGRIFYSSAVSQSTLRG